MADFDSMSNRETSHSEQSGDEPLEAVTSVGTATPVSLVAGDSSKLPTVAVVAPLSSAISNPEQEDNTQKNAAPFSGVDLAHVSLLSQNYSLQHFNSIFCKDAKFTV